MNTNPAMPDPSDDDEIVRAVLAQIALEPFQAPSPSLAQGNASERLQRAHSASDDADLEWLLGE